MHFGAAKEQWRMRRVVKGGNGCVAQPAGGVSKEKNVKGSWGNEHDLKCAMSQVKDAACDRRSKMMRAGPKGGVVTVEQREKGTGTRRIRKRMRRGRAGNTAEGFRAGVVKKKSMKKERNRLQAGESSAQKRFGLLVG
jgi:hypothetical protein